MTNPCRHLLPGSAARHLGILLFLAGLAALSALPAAAADSGKKMIDVPAAEAAVALKLVAQQTGVEVLFATEMTAAVRTRAAKGAFTPLEAMREILSGTGLAAEQDARSGVITIVHAQKSPAKNADRRTQPAAPAANEAPAVSGLGAGTLSGRVTDANTAAYLAGATVAILGSDLAATVEHDGSYRISGLSAGPATAVVTYVGYAAQNRSVTISAAGATRLDLALSPEVISLGAFVVEGAREGQARAINQQRAATNLKNIIAADAIGNFPDVNAAEALKRMPGVSTVRQRGEDRDITIRGAAPNLNAITIDGVSVLSNQVDGRTVSMDVYPAEQLAGVEITKSALPDMDGDSIGGVINLRSKSAFDTPRRILSANAYWQYNDLAEQGSYRAGLNYSDVFGQKKDWGVQFSASRAQRKALEETVEPSGWAVRSGPAANGTYAGYGPNTLPFVYVDIKRERTGGSATLERKLGADSLLYLRAAHNEFIERNARPRFVVQNVGAPAAAAPVTLADGRLTGFTSTTVRGQRVVNPRQFTDTGTTAAFGGRTQLESWKLELVGSYSSGTNRQDSVTGQWTTATNTTATFDLSDSERPRFTQTAGANLNDASAYAFSQLQVQDRKLKNREYSVKGDVHREFHAAGHPLRFSAGFKIRWSPKRWDQENQIYNTLTSGTLALSDSRLGGTAEVKRDFLGNLLAFGPTVAPFGFYDFAKANLALFTANAGNTLQNTLAADYYVSESINAGYTMAEWTRGKFTALAGLRYEQTETEAKAYRQNTSFATSNPARYTWVTNHSDYADVLPGVHLRYVPTKKFVLRASYNETLARPQTNRIAPSLNVTFPVNATASDPLIVSGGNPNLKATRSDNLDFSAEYYLKSIGLVSVGYFHKNLDGPIYRRTYDGTFEGQPARLTVFDNAGRSRVSGWEFTYQQQLGFLPAPFDALGIYANATLVDSSVTLTEPGRVGEQLPLFNQSKQLGNLALTYQKHDIFVRLSHNWRGDYLQALSGPGLDQYARGFESYDLLASYKLSKQWMLKLEATNLTAAPEQQYAGTSRRNLYYGDTGRSFALGVVFNY